MPFVNGKWVGPTRSSIGQSSIGKSSIGRSSVGRSAVAGGINPTMAAIAARARSVDEPLSFLRGAALPLQIIMDSIGQGDRALGSLAAGNFADAVRLSSPGQIVSAARGTPRREVGRQQDGYVPSLYRGAMSHIPGFNTPNSAFDKVYTASALGSVAPDLARGTGNFIGDVASSPLTYATAPVSALRTATAGMRSVAKTQQAARDIVGLARAAAMQGDRSLTPLQMYNLNFAGRVGRTPGGRIIDPVYSAPAGGRVANNQAQAAFMDLKVREAISAGSGEFGSFMRNAPLDIPGRDLRIAGRTMTDMPSLSQMRQVLPASPLTRTLDKVDMNTPAVQSARDSISAGAGFRVPQASGYLRDKFTVTGGMNPFVHAVGQDARRMKDAGENAADKAHEKNSLAFAAKVKALEDDLRADDVDTPFVGQRYKFDDASAGVTVEAQLPRYLARAEKENPERFANLSAEQKMDAAYEDYRAALKHFWNTAIPSRAAVRRNFQSDVDDLRRQLEQINSAELMAGLKRGQREFYVPQMSAINTRANRKKMVYFNRVSGENTPMSGRDRGKNMANIGRGYSVNPNVTAASMNEAVREDLMRWLLPKSQGGAGELPELNHLTLARMRQREHSRLISKRMYDNALARELGYTVDIRNSNIYALAVDRIRSLREEVQRLTSEYAALRKTKATTEAVASKKNEVDTAKAALDEAEAVSLTTPEMVAAKQELDDAVARGITEDPEVAAAQREVERLQEAKQPRRTITSRNKGGAGTEGERIPSSVEANARMLGRADKARDLRAAENEARKAAEALARREGQVFDTVARTAEGAAQEVAAAVARIRSLRATLDRAFAYREVAVMRAMDGPGIAGKGKKASGAGRGGLRQTQSQFVERARERLMQAERDFDALLNVSTDKEVARLEAVEARLDVLRSELSEIDAFVAKQEKALENALVNAKADLRVAKVKAEGRRRKGIEAKRKDLKRATDEGGTDKDAVRTASKEVTRLENQLAQVRKARTTIVGNSRQFRSIGTKLATVKGKLRRAEQRRNQLLQRESDLVKVPGKRITQEEFDALRLDEGFRALADQAHFGLTLVSPDDAAAIERMTGMIFGRVDGSPVAIFRFAQDMTAIWKRLALSSTGYAIRNFIGDTIGMWMGGFRDPESFAVALRLYRTNRDGSFKWTDQRVPNNPSLTYAELRQEIDELGIQQAGFAGADVRATYAKASKKRAKVGTVAGRDLYIRTPNAPGRGVYATKLRELNEARENWVRRAMYADMRRKGMNPQAARMNTFKWVFDYGDVAPAIAVARRFLMPFIVYPTKMYPRLIETLLTNPRVFNNYAFFTEEMHAASQQQAGETISMIDAGRMDASSFALPLPNFIRIPLGLGTDTPVVYNPANVLPFEQLNILSPQGNNTVRGAVAAPFISALAMTNPSIQSAAQLAGYNPRNFASQSEWRRAPVWLNALARVTGASGPTQDGEPNTIFGLIKYDGQRNSRSGTPYSAYDSKSAAILGMFPPLGQIDVLASNLVPTASAEDELRTRASLLRTFGGFDVKNYDQYLQAQYARNNGGR